jgi:lipopolysaccharide assembly protein A
VGRLIVILLLVATFCVGVALSFFNWTTVRFHYLAGEVESRLILLLLASFLMGMLLMGLFSFARMFMLGRESRRQQRQIRELESELKSLRNLPLAPATAPPNPPAKNA